VKPYRVEFAAPQSGDWFRTGNNQAWIWKPTDGEGLSITLSSGSFDSITAPAGYGSLRLAVNGVLVDTDFNAGETFAFGAGVSSFNLYGGGAPLFFPYEVSVAMQLRFSDSAGQMNWTSVNALPVPETSTFAMALLGLVGVGVLMGGKQRAKR
jgi:hypothetical protein